MSNKYMISIATDFTDTPAGRNKDDGPFSGERFRDEFLRNALENNEQVIVDLDGVLGFGSSFLEEAFGGLVRCYGFSEKELKKKLTIKASLNVYKTRIWSYIADAEKQRKKTENK